MWRGELSLSVRSVSGSQYMFLFPVHIAQSRRHIYLRQQGLHMAVKAGLHSNGEIRLISWNVRGMNSPVKRGKVFTHLKSLCGDIYFLQETHIKKSAVKQLQPAWASQIFQSNFSTKARGVAILIRKNVPFVHTQTISDQNGRYLVVCGTLNLKPVTLVNIYGPNFDDPVFFKKLFNIIPNMPGSNVIIGGDHNCLMDSKLDKSPSQLNSSKSSTTLNTLVQSYNLVDIWRLLHPTGRDFSFFSPVHKSYSRIDYFLIDAGLISTVTACTYHNILISDHAPVSLDLKFGLDRGDYSWRLNASLLNNPDFCSFISEQISTFLNNNDKGDVNDSVLWESMKAVLRGQIISYEAAERKRARLRLERIEEELTSLETEYKNSQTTTTLNKIISLKYEYNSIISKNVEKLLMRVRQQYFELGDKPHRLLARQLRQAQAARAIYSIKSRNGTTLTDPQKINKCFADFYADVYQTQGKVDVNIIKNFFTKLDMPKLSEEAVRAMDEDITLKEISSAISSFPNNKASGPDGFGIEFFKMYDAKISPLLLRMFNHSSEASELPPSLYKANITLILKPDRDATEVSSYRPISLLPIETKIIGKILANRLKAFICTIIHPDQTGFMPGRHIYFNLRRLFNIIYANHTSEAAIISLDAQRAFDQVEWQYMSCALEEFGFGPLFRKWIDVIYLRPVASVITNQNTSHPIEIHRGTRQGCPLSPFLFAVMVEPLAVSVRQNPEICPINLQGLPQHLSLYADDILLYLSSPETSIPPLLSLINHFSSFSGFTINWEKSELMPISTNISKQFLQNSPFKKAYSSFTYLGIIVTKKAEDLLKINWQKKLDQLKQKIEFWKTLYISMAGKINAIKMVVLPRFLYLFQAIPSFIPLSYFKQLDSIIVPFLWGYKAVRIAKKHLIKPKAKGGFSLPHFKAYYWAAHLNFITWWKKGPPSDSSKCPAWLSLERTLCNKTSLLALLNSPTKINQLHYSNSFVVKNTLKIWKQIKLHTKTPNMYIDSPICKNHAFLPGLSDRVFADWKLKGIKDISALYLDGHFMSFKQLQNVYGIPNSNHFRYLQIRDFVRTNIPNFENICYDNFLESISKVEPGKKGAVSYFYQAIEDYVDVNTTVCKQNWETELGEEISEETWEECLGSVHKCSINSRHNLIQFKTLHRLYYSKDKLHKIFPDVSPLCNRCNETDGSLTHSLWSCRKLFTYWKSIFECFSKAFEKTWEPNPLAAVLGATNVLLTVDKYESQAIAYGMIVARKLILLLWKSDSVPTYVMWIRELMNVLHLERLRFSSKNKVQIFNRIWSPVLEYLRDS